MLKLFFVVCLIVVVFTTPALSQITTIVYIINRIDAAINATPAPTPPPTTTTTTPTPLTADQLQRLFNSCVKVQDYWRWSLFVTRVTEIKVCHDLCPHTYKYILNISKKPLDCNFWIFTTTADADGLHRCEFKASLPGKAYLIRGWVDPNRRGAHLSCITDNMQCFYYGRFKIGGTIYIKTGTTKIGCYEFCLRKGSECKVFEYSFQIKECRTASMNLGDLSIATGWVSGFPRCDPGPVPTPPTIDQLERLINSCAKVQDYNYRLLAVTRVTEMKVCHDLCPLTSKVFLTQRAAPFFCNFWIFSIIADADGLYRCELKATEPVFKKFFGADPNRRGALISCTTDAMRCFHYGRYNIGGTIYIKTATTKVGCYEFCLEKGSECQVFEYSFQTKECKTASINFGDLRIQTDWLSGFPRCDPIFLDPDSIDTPTGPIDTPTGSIDTPTGSIDAPFLGLTTQP